MARRPRPTHREMDSLRRRYDAVVATLHRVLDEREELKKQLEIANSNIVAIQKREADVINQREFYISQLDATIASVRALRPLTVRDLWRWCIARVTGREWVRG